MVNKLLYSLLSFFIAVFITNAGAIAITTSVPVELTIDSTSLKVEGLAAPGSLVTIKKGSNVIATTTADSFGAFSSIIILPYGINNIDVYHTDTSGIRSAVSSQSISLQPQTETTTDIFLAPTLIRLGSGQVELGSLVQLRGYTVPNSQVDVSVDGVLKTSVNSNSQGRYDFYLSSSDFGLGAKFASVIAKTVSKTSNVSNRVQFSVQSSSNPSQPTPPDIVVSPDKLPPPIPISPADGSVINGSNVVISGESVPLAQINIYEDNVVIGSVFADSNGKWSFKYEATKSPVTLTFDACLDGVCSLMSTSITLHFTLQANCRLGFKLEEYRFWDIETDEKLNLVLAEESSDGVYEISWGDGTIEKFNFDSNMSREISKVYNKNGQFNGLVTLNPGSDCERTRYFSVNAVENDSTSREDKLFWAFLIVVGMLTIGMISRREQRKQASSRT